MKCRELQTRVLTKLLDEEVHPAAIGVHGPRGTGKTVVLKEFMSNATFTSSWVQCDQCVTARILLQRALRQIFLVTHCGTPEEAVCENIDIFVNLITEKFQRHNFTEKHVLVLDRIDQLPDYRATLDLYSCLSRIPELSPKLKNFIVIFVYSTAEPRALIANPAVPRVWFPRFTEEEALYLLKSSKDQICLTQAGVTEMDFSAMDFSDSFKEEFLELVFNALSPTTGTDIAQLKRIVSKIWPAFVSAADSKSDTVAKLYVRKSHLFAADRVIDKLSVPEEASQLLHVSPVSCYLLCAAYLASYNSPRYDMRYFSLAKTMRNKRRETRPKKAVAIPARSLAPPAFEMERLLAIFHAINPEAFTFHPTNQVGRELATLTAQNMIVKSQPDPLDSRTKWRINVPWSYVQRLAIEIGFNIEDYLVEA